ncbi:hypothetical protein LEP1GSC061_3192 [Leptospira wolffii serovar Khorat str. Khorat-H2]|nr:hypothetical protein LEP1GSC061_3192 [Leptospira wolffii serovar Khorat str. Khorat-H2]
MKDSGPADFILGNSESEFIFRKTTGPKTIYIDSERIPQKVNRIFVNKELVFTRREKENKEAGF